MKKTRITDAKLKRAAEIAKEKGVRVTIGDYVFEPGGANDHAADARRGSATKNRRDGASLMADDNFSKSIDDVYQSGKINGLMQAQVIALQYATEAGSMGSFHAREIAEQIGQAAAVLQGDGPADDEVPQGSGIAKEER